ncbi:MAG: hypothetical protein E7K04_04255 [Helicobacter sp.]|nr:hypothetical protein [Helicobacter sp.]
MRVAKFLSVAVVLSGTLMSAESSIFGHFGLVYDQGLSGGNKNGVDGNKLARFGGVTTHLGYDLTAKNIGFGIGIYAGAGFSGTKVQVTKRNEAGEDVVGTDSTTAQTEMEDQGRILYGKQYGDLSDLYIRYDTGDLRLQGGRFDSEFIESDWLNTHVQGLGAFYNDKRFGAWGLWANDYTSYGYSANIEASELAAYRPFSVPKNFGKKQIFAGGVNLMLSKSVTVKPFVNYYSNEKSDIFQAGGSAIFTFGDRGPNKSTTALRAIFQSRFNETKNRTLLFWADQEFVVQDLLKLGGGFVQGGLGGGRIFTPNDYSRFYAHKFITPTSYNQNTQFFHGATNLIYIFGGVENEFVDIDLLVAKGTFSEFSAIASWKIVDKPSKFTKDNFLMKLGIGFVNHNYKDKDNQNGVKNNVFAFAKMSF